jgi:hypothetical protein
MQTPLRFDYEEEILMVRNQPIKQKQKLEYSSTTKNNENMVFIRKFVYTKFTNRSSSGALTDLNNDKTTEASSRRDLIKQPANEVAKVEQQDEDRLSDLDSDDILSPLTDSDSSDFLESLI